MIANYGQSKGQEIAQAVLKRLDAEQKAFDKVVQSQRDLCATMLGHDIGLEIDMVVGYDGELAIITNIILDPSNLSGVSLRVESYSDDLKYAVVSPEQVTV